MSLPSASKLQRAAVCPGAGVLAVVDRVSEAADSGSDGHKRLEDDASLADALLVEAGLVLLPDAVVRREPAFAYNVDTGNARFIGYGREAYVGANVGPRDILGTLDYLEQRADEAQVVDFKFGRPEFLPEVADSYQLAFAALVADRPHVRVAYLFVAEEDHPWARRADWDEWVLDEWREKMRKLADKVQAAEAAVAAGRRPPLTEGDHCRWCPAFSACPAKTALVRAAFADPGVIEREVVALTPDEWGRAWARYKLYKDALRQVESVLYGAARQDGGIPLPNGKTVREVTTSRREIDGALAEPVLAGLFGADVAVKVVERAVSQSSIKDAVGSAGLKKAMAALDAAGAVTVKERREVREVSE